MAKVSSSNGKFSVTAYAGDAKALLAFDLAADNTTNLAGFTIECTPDGKSPYYLHNELQFQTPANHAQDPNEPPNSSINAPIHKFRWIHVLGLVHQGLKPLRGKYTYTVTPRYFNQNQSLLALDPGLSVSVDIDVIPFEKNGLRLGFARGFTQSQAFVHHFGEKALIRPKSKDLIFDTSQVSGKNAFGEQYTFADEYDWLGFTAREQIFELLNEVKNTPSTHLDMFAYDLNEPDLIQVLLDLAGQGRVRVILDNASLHHDASGSKSEDQFEAEFRKVMKGDAAICRGKFGRYAHDKVLILSDGKEAYKVLTGSTNFSITGIYVNSNHVIVIEEKQVAGLYQSVFNETWNDNISRVAFRKTALATQKFPSPAQSIPSTGFTFSPHPDADASKFLTAIKDRIEAEGAKPTGGSVFFAVMEIDNGVSPVFQALGDIHQNTSIFSFGISDNPKGIFLYKPGTKQGLQVTGKPASAVLPKPFDQTRHLGAGHQVHHKFVVCGFNQPDAVVYCGSSNLALGGEEENGDNLLEIHDADVATVFVIEALGLVDHFNFLDKVSTGGVGSKNLRQAVGAPPKPPTVLKQAAVSAGWFLSTTDRWVKPYYDPNDLKCVDRILFGTAPR